MEPVRRSTVRVALVGRHPALGPRMSCDVSFFNWATGKMPELMGGGPDSPTSPRVSQAEGPGPGLRPQAPTSKSKLPLTPFSAGLCGEHSIFNSLQSCDDQLHNPSTSQILPFPLGPALHQRVEQDSSPSPCISPLPAAVCAPCPSQPQRTANRPREPSCSKPFLFQICLSWK